MHNLGILVGEQGEHEEAAAHYRAALTIHRETGNRRFEGGVLGNLGELLAARGQIELGLQALQAGEQALREVDDPLDRAKLLCAKGRTALTCGDPASARQALAEAQAIGARLGAEPVSDLGRQIEALRSALTRVP